jgi:hypothetical protein
MNDGVFAGAVGRLRRLTHEYGLEMHSRHIANRSTREGSAVPSISRINVVAAVNAMLNERTPEAATDVPGSAAGKQASNKQPDK